MRERHEANLIYRLNEKVAADEVVALTGEFF